MNAAPKFMAFALAVVMALSTADAWAAKKKRMKRPPAPEIARDYGGTPIIMKGCCPTYGIPDIMREERPHAAPPARVERPVTRPRGSSTYVPPSVPSPSAPNSPPPAVLLQVPSPAVYSPPATNSFGDRVRNCIHSAPLNTGIGNNPADRSVYIRQCAN